MALLTAATAAKLLNINKRTLLRWEEEGRIRVKREGILKVRVYEEDYIMTIKKIIEINKKQKEHLSKLPDIINEGKKHMLQQTYIPGKNLRLSTQSEIDASMEAFKHEEDWMTEHKRLLNELLSYPRDVTLEILRFK